MKGNSDKERCESAAAARLQDEKVSGNTLSLSLTTSEEKVKGKMSIRMQISVPSLCHKPPNYLLDIKSWITVR